MPLPAAIVGAGCGWSGQSRIHLLCPPFTFEQPQAKVIVALTTPLKPGSPKAELNPRVEARNVIVRDLARQFEADIDDLHAISAGHADYYVDPYHYNPEAISLQAAQVSKAALRVLPGTVGKP